MIRVRVILKRRVVGDWQQCFSGLPSPITLCHYNDYECITPWPLERIKSYLTVFSVHSHVSGNSVRTYTDFFLGSWLPFFCLKPLPGIWVPPNSRIKRWPIGRGLALPRQSGNLTKMWWKRMPYSMKTTLGQKLMHSWPSQLQAKDRVPHKSCLPINSVFKLISHLNYGRMISDILWLAQGEITG